MILLSLVIVLCGGFFTGLLFSKIKLPKIVGMLLFGILIGPSVLNIVDDYLISISAILRQIALVEILTRAGLSLDFKKLKTIGRPALFLSFIPATFEIIGVALVAPFLLKINLIDSLLLGSVLAAVSPAIVAPRMIKAIEEGYGQDKSIPDLILAGASVDDIYVIILFYSFIGLSTGSMLSAWTILQIPISIILGLGLGVVCFLLIKFIFKQFYLNNLIKIGIILSLSFVLVSFEILVKPYVSISALISIITIGILIFKNNATEAKEIEGGYKKLWFVFEILLFVLVGVSVDLNYAVSAGFMPVIVLFIALIFRTLGVYMSLLATKLTYQEKLFVVFSYLPKATVQASIGGIALSMHLESGSLILTTAVLAILITAPIGAFLIDHTYKIILKKPSLIVIEK